MSDGQRSRYRNPWVIAGMVLGALTLMGLGLFIAQVVTYMGALQRGEDPFQQDQLRASVTSALSQTPVKNTDLTRLESGTNPLLGNPDAKIHIVEFLDYQCPFSKAAALEVRAFMAKHPDDVLFEVRDFPLESIHDQALNAADAAQCIFAQGDANKFWNYHDRLFQYQDQLSPTSLRSIASSVGADLAAYDDCVANRVTESTIKTSYEDGMAAGVRGTPTFFVNGIRVPGALDLATLELIYQKVSATTN